MIAGDQPPPGSPQAEPRRDQLTIRRLLILTAGLAAGLGIFAPQVEQPPAIGEPDWWISLSNAVLIGLALPGPLFTVRLPWRKAQPLGIGGLFALVAGLGALLMLPPALVARLSSQQAGAVFCLAYALPLMGLWFVLAGLLSGQATSLFKRDTPWTERYGALLALSWSPLGAWHLYHFYAEAF